MRLHPTLRIALLGAALILPAAARAQGAPQGAPPQAEAPPPSVEQRIQMLHTQLGIAPQQEAVWNNFAQSMRDNATETERLAQQRSSTVATLNAVDNMRSYARIAHEYAADADRLTAAFERLYAALSATQRQAADTLLRQQGAPGQ
jgi:hypothetical protein